MKKALPAIVAILIVAAVLVAARVFAPPAGSGGGGGGSGGGSGGDGPVIVGAVSSSEVVLEAEGFSFDDVWKVKQDGDASGGREAHIPENPDRSELNPRWKTSDGKPIPDTELSNYKDVKLVHNGVGSLDFQAPADGDYTLWMRMKGLHSCADSVDFSVDGGAETMATTSTHRVWSWVQPRDEQTGEPRRWRLAKGAHRMTLFNREDGTEVDQILFTTSEVVPTGVKSAKGKADN
jgi:hypothetical protein